VESEAATAAVDDPFAGGAGDDPFANGEPPVVNKEGEPVEAVEDPDTGLDAGEVPAAPEPPAPAPAAEEPGTNGSGAVEAVGEAEKPKSPMRHYHILYRTGEKEWTEAEWDADGTPTRVVQARNNDHALRLAFTILGSPEHGVEVLPVPVSGFKPKRLKPKPVVPRTALDIS
jgi:hypothetical protein